jgi:hypothetical protein
MAMGAISSDWPAMPQQEDQIDDKIHAADDDDEEKQLAPPRRSAQVQERKEREVAGTVNAIFSTPTPTRGEEKKKPPLPEGREKEEEREGQQQPPTCSSGQHRPCRLGATKLLSGQVQSAAAPMGLPKKLTGQFVFFQQINNNHTFLMKQRKSTLEFKFVYIFSLRQAIHGLQTKGTDDTCILPIKPLSSGPQVAVKVAQERLQAIDNKKL